MMLQCRDKLKSSIWAMTFGWPYWAPGTKRIATCRSHRRCIQGDCSSCSRDQGCIRQGLSRLSWKCRSPISPMSRSEEWNRKTSFLSFWCQEISTFSTFSTSSKIVCLLALLPESIHFLCTILPGAFGKAHMPGSGKNWLRGTLKSIQKQDLYAKKWKFMKISSIFQTVPSAIPHLLSSPC